MPSRCASCASKRHAVKSSSLAFRAPNSQVWPWYSTPPMPMRSTGSLKCAFSAAMIRSHGQHSIMPAAMQAPCTAAIEGFGTSRHFRE